MIKIWITLVLGLWAFDSKAQESSCDSIHLLVDQMPTFGKEPEDFLRHLVQNMRFKKSCRPEELRKMTWTIDRLGKMVDIDVVGLGGECKSQIIEQLKLFPAWAPGRLNGEPVALRWLCRYVFDRFTEKWINSAVRSP